MREFSNLGILGIQGFWNEGIWGDSGNLGGFKEFGNFGKSGIWEFKVSRILGMRRNCGIWEFQRQEFHWEFREFWGTLGIPGISEFREFGMRELREFGNVGTSGTGTEGGKFG